MKKKIVLFQHFVFSEERMFFNIPLAILGISRLLDKEGYQIKIITPCTHENYVEAVLSEAKGAICFGTSVITGQAVDYSLKVSKALKAKYPELPTVWGGWHPSILPIETIKNENVDIVVKGQGERTFTELVHALEKNTSLKDMLGIVYKDKEGNIFNNPDRPLETLDNFPPIPYHLVDVEKFVIPTDFSNRSLYYYSSYGCPHRCLFCVEPAVNKQRWVGLDPERAADEITFLKEKYNLDSVQITDSNFFISEDRAKRFAQRLIDNKTNIKWGNANGRARQMSIYSDETWKLLEESGLASILVGAESGDNETLDYMQKDINIDDIVKFMTQCSRYNIRVLCAFMAGFPRDIHPAKCQEFVDKEIDSVLKMIDKLLKIHPNTRMMLSLFLPYPSSGFFELSKKLGVKMPSRLEDWSKYLITAEKADKIVARQKWITKKQAFKIMMCSVYIFFFLDADSLRILTKNTRGVKKFLLSWAFNAGRLMVGLRWKYKFFNLPIDFYLFELLRNKFSY